MAIHVKLRKKCKGVEVVDLDQRYTVDRIFRCSNKADVGKWGKNFFFSLSPLFSLIEPDKFSPFSHKKEIPSVLRLYIGYYIDEVTQTYKI